MSQNRLKVCPYCQRTVRGRCEKCSQKREADPKPYEFKPRESAAKRGYGSKWREARAAWLKKHPWCVDCLKIEKQTLANVVDHIIPHRGDKKLFWDRTNWQSLCKKHHDIKTARGE